MVENLNICLSGGAKGADTEWGICANLAGHDVVHWIFDGYGKKSNLSNMCILDREKLEMADQYLKIANKSLKRSWPTKFQYTNDLLRRNYYQINWSTSVYAISSFTNDSSLLKISGGTAWACQMYVDKWLYGNGELSTCQLYLFDQNTDNWYNWSGEWKPILLPPPPTGVYAGIGTRDLSSAGKCAIKNVYGNLSG